jgi:hypothetical protein
LKAAWGALIFHVPSRLTGSAAGARADSKAAAMATQKTALTELGPRTRPLIFIRFGS